MEVKKITELEALSNYSSVLGAHNGEVGFAVPLVRVVSKTLTPGDTYEVAKIPALVLMQDSSRGKTTALYLTSDTTLEFLIADLPRDLGNKNIFSTSPSGIRTYVYIEGLNLCIRNNHSDNIAYRFLLIGV